MKAQTKKRSPGIRRSSSCRRPSFAKVLASDRDLSALRAEYAGKTLAERRAAAEWAYDEDIATNLFAAAIALAGQQECSDAKWPSGFAALAIDPDYAPALMTVGCYEYGSGRKTHGMDLLLHLAQLPQETPELAEIIDQAGQYLVDASAPQMACRLYRTALDTQPCQQSFIVGLGWALCRAGQHAEALPWLSKAVANAPTESATLNDYGWALAELGRYEEAEPILTKAAHLAVPGYDLPRNNLRRMRELRKGCP